MIHSTRYKWPLVRPGGSSGVLVGVLVVLSVMMAGCFEPPLPPGAQVAQEPSPSVTPTSTNTPVPEWPPTWTPTPTHTPWPTVTPTATPTFTPTPIVPVAPRGSVSGPSCRPGQSKGPLTIDFEINGVSCRPGVAYVAEISVWASGGDGCYTYYRDIDLIGGPTRGTGTFELKWATCEGAPGTLFVESGDGQRASVKFWVHRPSCCK